MKLRLLAIGLCAALGACADVYPEPPAPPPPPARAAARFSPSEFAWSTAPGSATVRGLVDYTHDGRRYSCAGQAVLTPDAPYSRRRILQLYGSSERAALPVADVRSRQANRPSDDYSAYVRRSGCDGAGRFVFSGLPAGGWFVIVVAQPADGGAAIALMRRVDTGPGAVKTVVLQ
ncbi:MAG TPA: hypothetical protein VIJ94_18920 [Caulobacteraceae bacterium]